MFTEIRRRMRVPAAMGALMMLVVGLVFVAAAMAGATGGDAVTSVSVGCDGKVTYTSNKDLSNIIIQYADGFEIKIDDNELSGTSHTTDYEDPVHGAIVKVWIHAGDNHNDSDPQPTNYSGNSVGEYHSVPAPNCGTTTTTQPAPTSTTTWATTTTQPASTTTYHATTTTQPASTTTYATTTTQPLSTTTYLTTTTRPAEATSTSTSTTFINTEGETSTLPATSTTVVHVVAQGSTTTTVAATGAAAANNALPFTGGNSRALAIVGLALMTAGVLTAFGGRRRRAVDTD